MAGFGHPTPTVVLDIFSRYALGWRVEAVEDGRLATDMIADIIATQDTPPVGSTPTAAPRCPPNR